MYIKVITALVCAMFSLSTAAFAADTPDTFAEDISAQKVVVKVSEKGFEPQTVHLQKEDASIFFVNTTQESLLTFEINFGSHRAHCATSNMKLGTDGILRSSKPVGPKDFALMCFPQKGSYPVVVHGIHGSAAPVTGTVVVD